METTIQLEGVNEAIRKLDTMELFLKPHLARAMYRISTIWKRTAVEYAPISPTTQMLKAFAKQSGSEGGILYAAGRKGKSGIAVKLTAFYQHRMNGMINSAKAGSRPTPGSLMRSIQVASSDAKAECFVPSNSPAGTYAFKIHEEKGKSWKNRGPGTQAKGPQADAKFISRAATDRRGDFVAIVEDEINKLTKAQS